MSDIQRWYCPADQMYARKDVDEKCYVIQEEVVTYADHVEALDAAVEATRTRAYTLMGAAIQNGIDAERKRIRFAIAALVDGDVIDVSLYEYRAVLEAIDEEEL
jgi:hypothetical protein